MRLIDANDLYTRFEEIGWWDNYDRDIAEDLLDKQKIFDAVPVVHAHWIYKFTEPVIELIKKKIPQTAYTKTIMLASFIDITLMNQSEEEQKAIRQELLSDKGDKSEKNMNG